MVGRYTEDPIILAKRACNELIRDLKRKMYRTSYEDQELDKLRVIRKGLWHANRVKVGPLRSSGLTRRAEKSGGDVG